MKQKNVAENFFGLSSISSFSKTIITFFVLTQVCLRNRLSFKVLLPVTKNTKWSSFY